MLGVDPGNEQTALVWFETGSQRVLDKQKSENAAALVQVTSSRVDHLAIEMIASYGMPVGAEVFDTCVWIGRYVQAWHGPFTLIYRREVKSHLCHDSKAKDGNIRQALIDRFGPGRDKAIGKKKKPGPLHGFADDLWSALAVAVTYGDRVTKERAA